MNDGEFTRYQRALDIRAKRHMNDPVKAFQLKDATQVQVFHGDRAPSSGFLTKAQTLRLGLKLLRIWLGRIGKEGE